MVGTMTRPAESAGLNVIDRFRVEGGTASGLVTLERGQGSTVLVNVRLESGDEFELDLDFSGNGLDLDAFALRDGRPDAINYMGDVLRVKGRGAQNFVVMLNPAAAGGGDDRSRIDLVVRQQGEPVQSGSLDLGNASG